MAWGALDLRGEALNPRRVMLVVAACAIVVYVGALWNGFALDDVAIIMENPLVRSGHGLWRAFAEPYWPPDLGGQMYRPIPVATYAADAQIGQPWWFHAINLLWHAGATVAVAWLAQRLAGDRAALAAGIVFAVHPVHVEAVANVVGRAELMATLFAVLCVYATVTRRHPAWSALAFAAGLLCKENAVVAPALAAWAWMVGIDRPSRRVMVTYACWWVGVGVAYGVLRWAVLHPYAHLDAIAATLVGESPVAMKLTATAALADLVRLLVFPLTLRVEYSPAERTVVRSVLDGRFLLGAAAFALWAWLLFRTWRRGQKVEAFGLGWIGVAYLPVANFLFPTGVVMAERTLYLASAGFAIALGAWAVRWNARVFASVVAIVGIAGGARTALRVPVWRDDRTVTLSMLRDSPNSYRGPARAGAMYQTLRDPEHALRAYRTSLAIFDRDANTYVAAADAAFTLGRPALADSMLEGANRICFRCTGALRVQAGAARARGDSATSDSLLARARRLDQQ